MELHLSCTNPIGLEPDRYNSIANAMELRLYGINPLICNIFSITTIEKTMFMRSQEACNSLVYFLMMGSYFHKQEFDLS